MKKLLCMLLAVLMLVSLVACGSKDDAKDDSVADSITSGEQSDAGSADASDDTSDEASDEQSTDAAVEVVALPDVKGKTEEEALSALAAAGYTNVKTVACYKAGSTAGTVVAQSKTPDSIYDGEGLVILQVSNGLSAADSASTEIVDPLLADRETLEQGANADYQPLNYENMKAMWLSQLDLIPVYYDYENKTQRTEDDFAVKLDVIMKNLKDSGYNTVVVQVHPDCDSMYVSEYYPWSDYLNGNSNRDANQVLKSDVADDVTSTTYGNTSLYDLMPIMIATAHKYELSFQAWINPMRAYAIDEMQYVNDSFTIKQWFNDEEKASTYLFKTTSRYYLNPAYQEVRDYITAVAVELCRYYDIDGVHMDDYFYPSADASYDTAAFAAQSEFATLNEFRKNNVNLLVKQIYDAVKAENENMLFGISPAGNIDNNMNTLSADVETWCTVDGYIDYICPQIYFGLEHGNFPFDQLSQRWIDMTTAESVDVVIGLTMHKIGKNDQYALSGAMEWMLNSDILMRCFQWVGENLESIDGFCMFSYQYMFDPVSGERVDYTKDEVDNFLPVMQGISW